MVNNAAVMGATGSIANLVLADVDRTVAVILGGAVLGMKHAARVMLPQRRGVILTVSSPAGVVGGVGPHAYSAAKAAVLGLTRSVAAELRPHGIRVNAIIPGAIVTAMTADIVIGDPADLEGAATKLGADAPIGRPGYPSDIAARPPTSPATTRRSSPDTRWPSTPATPRSPGRRRSRRASTPRPG